MRRYRFASPMMHSPSCTRLVSSRALTFFSETASPRSPAAQAMQGVKHLGDRQRPTQP